MKKFALIIALIFIFCASSFAAIIIEEEDQQINTDQQVTYRSRLLPPVSKPDSMMRPGIRPQARPTRMRPQFSTIYGRWESIVNNQKWVMIYDKNNNYRGWIDGSPTESGVFLLNGNILSGRNDLGEEFTAEIEFSQGGNILVMRFPDGSIINYSRVQ